MRTLLTLWIWLTAFAALSQDQVFMLDGSKKDGQVLEVGLETISLQVKTRVEAIDRSQILLIHYSNGFIEHFNEPESDATYRPGTKQKGSPSVKSEPLTLVSFNVAGLVNADVGGSYEKLIPKKTFGFGGLVSVNFNRYVNFFYNYYLGNLTNCKKVADLGAFVNFYNSRFEKHDFWYFGLMAKYTPLRYTSVIEDTVSVGGIPSSVLHSSDARATQFSFMASAGRHYSVGENMFLRMQFSLGLFAMGDEFRKQMNEGAKRTSGSSTTTNFGVLPKTYVAINFGWMIQ